MRNCAELADLAWKIAESRLSRALGIFLIFLSAEFPFSEHRILGGLFRTPLQFFSAKFAVSENRILAGLVGAVFQCKTCFF